MRIDSIASRSFLVLYNLIQNTKSTKVIAKMRTPILQFGTSRFLQAHADLFVSEAMAEGQAVGPITVVQSSGHAGRAARLEAMTKGFDVRIEGLVDGVRSQNTTRVASVARTLSTAQNWDAIVEIFSSEVDIVISNTGDRGFEPSEADQSSVFTNDMSFPAKLLHLLAHRHKISALPIQIMPMELIANNGDVLRARIMELAAGHSEALQEYLGSKVTWVNSLVDRVVSEPLEPAGAVAEPYALWAIENQEGLRPICTHSCIKIVDEILPMECLKLYVLNLGHTYMAQRWLDDGAPEGRTVLDVMQDQNMRDDLIALYSKEVRPAFLAARLDKEIDLYIETTLDRFANPFLRHQLSDIAGNHSEKIKRRIVAFLEWAGTVGDTQPKPELSRIVSANL